MERIALSELLPGVQFFEGVSGRGNSGAGECRKIMYRMTSSRHGYMAKLPASLSNWVKLFIPINKISLS